MKKSLLLLVLSFVSFSEAQTLYVKKKTEVKVKPGALVYVSGDMKVESSVVGLSDERTGGRKTEGYVSNEGNVHITGDLEIQNTVNGNDFVNELVSDGSYGQLIVNGSAVNNGDISADVNFMSEKFSYYSFTLPFKDSNVVYPIATIYSEDTSEARNNIIPYIKGYTPNNGTGAQAGFDQQRYKNLVFSWDNTAGEQRLDNFTVSTQGLKTSPGTYLALNVTYSGKGKPTKGGYVFGNPQTEDLTIKAKAYKVGNNKAYNKYGEQYGSYVVDYVNNMPQGFNKYTEDDPIVDAGNFGANVFLFGNPYTSNINLYGDTSNTTFKNDKIVAIVQFGASNTYNVDVNNIDGVNNTNTAAHSSSGKPSANYMAYTNNDTGNAAAVIVRPYQTFAVQLKPSVTGDVDFKFTQGMKTFGLNNQNPTNTLLTAKNASNKEAVNQVSLSLYDEKGNFTGADTYVVASKIYEAGRAGKGIELNNAGIGKDDVAIYTLQEDEDGSVNSKLLNEKSYVNGVNADKYVGKPIHLVLQNVKGKHIIKANLNESLANNKNAFYFEDKELGKVIKVNKDFSYKFNSNGTDKERFVLYWAKTPKSELSKELVKESKSATIVYKDASGVYKVRFDEGINKADIFVYSISGQLVNVAKGLSTQSDYVIPVKGNSSIYVVKVVGDNGEVTTKKIIK